MSVAANGSEDQKPALSLRLFGPIEVRRNGAPLPSLRSRKGYSLLALLTLRHGRAVERAWLAGTLWPESPEAASLHNLRNSLTDLRRALGPEAARLQAPTPHMLCLDLTGAEADVVAFDAAVRQGDPSSLRCAVALYRGPLVEGCTEEWLFGERFTRQEAFLQALETLAQQAVDAGELRLAEGYLRRAAAADPLRESVQRQLMQVLAASGNYAAVVELYRELRLRLHHDLHTEPDAETTSLFQQLRAAARQGLGASQRAGMRGQGSERPGSGDRGQGSGREPEPVPELTPGPYPLTPGAERLAPATLPPSLTRGRMVGRDRELSELKGWIDAALAGAGATCFLAGEPGIGKTRLATEAGAYARRRGLRVLSGRCDEQGAAPYQPWAEALREYLEMAGSSQMEQALPPPVACELVRLVPQIASKVKEIPQIPPLPPDSARQALTDAVRQFFAAVTTQDAPALLLLDDLHWADEGSLALLHALARQAPSLRLLILGTYRDLEVEAQHPLERTLAALNRERVSRQISLRRLSEPAVAEMAAALLDEPFPLPSPTQGEGDMAPPSLAGKGAGGLGLPLAALLHRQTEGNPFFVEEMLQHLVEEGVIYREDGRWQIQLPEQPHVPHSIQVTIGRRLQRLTEESREALTLAAVIGQQFSFDVLLQASGLEEERLLDMLDEWLGAHLVVEQRLGRQEVYQFQHALVRAVLYDGLSRRRRARLHERVGLALEAVYANSLEAHLEELAHHFAQACSGSGMDRGVDYCLHAGEKARHLYANGVAIHHLTAALGLLEALPEDERYLRKRWEAVENLAKTYLNCRAFERAQEVLQDYLALAQRACYPWGIAAAYCEMGWALRESHLAAGLRTESARRRRIEHFEQSLQMVEQHGLPDRRVEACLSLAYVLCQFRYDLPRAEALLRATLHAPEGLREEESQEIYSRLMHACALQGKWDDVAAALRDSVALGTPSVPARANSYSRWSAPGLLRNPLGTTVWLACCLGAMEDALDRGGRHGEFIAFCEEAKTLYTRAGLPLPLHQWYLEPAPPSEEFSRLLFQDDFEGPELRPEWQWHDPAQVSSYSLSDKPGSLTLRAALGVNLFPQSNLNAPRMLLEVRGDFALETKMEGNWDEDAVRQPISGLLVWKDAQSHLRLERFSARRWQQGSIQLGARIAGDSRTAGRGLLRGQTCHLRIERTGNCFAALCSADGARWLSCGQVVLPVQDLLLVGVAAMEGAVVHFDYVQVLGKD